MDSMNRPRRLPRRTSFAVATAMLALIPATAALAAFSGNNAWRNAYKVGDRAPITISGLPEDAQICTVTENEPEQVMRVYCDAFKHWVAGTYIVSKSNFDGAAPQTPVAAPIPPTAAPTPVPSNSNTSKSSTSRSSKSAKTSTGSGGSGLKLGEYACTGSGGRMMIGLGFKVLPGNRYVDLDGRRGGTYSTAGGKVTFKGGHMAGVVGRNLKDYWFTVASQADCGPY